MKKETSPLKVLIIASSVIFLAALVCFIINMVSKTNEGITIKDLLYIFAMVMTLIFIVTLIIIGKRSKNL